MTINNRCYYQNILAQNHRLADSKVLGGKVLVHSSEVLAGRDRCKDRSDRSNSLLKKERVLPNLKNSSYKNTPVSVKNLKLN
jgi:hypothetical protein